MKWKNEKVLYNVYNVVGQPQFFSLELPQHYRAIAKYDNGYLIWFWCGSHESYNREASVLATKYAHISLTEEVGDDQVEDLFVGDALNLN